MATTEETRIYQGDTIRLVETDFSTEAHEATARAVIDLWGQGYSHDEIADEVGYSSSTVRHVMNHYFEPVEDGETRDEQAVVGPASIEEARAQAKPKPEPEPEQEAPPRQRQPPRGQQYAEPPGRAESGAVPDDARVAQIADWYGVTEEQARVMARAEQETGIELTGQESVQTEPARQPERPPEPPAGARQRGPEPSEATEEVLDVYRRGFVDGFDAALEHLQDLREAMEA